MSRHKHKNPRVKVYFKNKGHLFKLFETINFGTKSEPQLKIKGLTETYMQIRDDQRRFDGNIHVGQYIRFVDGNHVEFTYHKDGSIFAETIQPHGKKEYHNPYGKDERWTPIRDITTFQPVMILLISSITSYRATFIEEKYGLINYVIKNDRLFEFSKGQGALVLVYIRNKNYPLVKYCFEGIYSDVLMSLSDNLDLCIMIQKQSGQEGAGSWKLNSFLFLDRLDGFDYLNSVLRDHIFDPVFSEFMNVLQEDNCYFDISETMMQVIESVDPFYDTLREKRIPIFVHKPTLVRALLDVLEGKYEEYLMMSKDRRMHYILALYLGVKVREVIKMKQNNNKKEMMG